jgi:hypothetical protein
LRITEGKKQIHSYPKFEKIWVTIYTMSSYL